MEQKLGRILLVKCVFQHIATSALYHVLLNRREGIKEVSCYNPLIVEGPLVLNKNRCNMLWQLAWSAWYKKRLMYFKMNDTQRQFAKGTRRNYDESIFYCLSLKEACCLTASGCNKTRKNLSLQTFHLCPITILTILSTFCPSNSFFFLQRKLWSTDGCCFQHLPN